MIFNHLHLLSRNNKFTYVNVCFQYKHNEVRGHYRHSIYLSIVCTFKEMPRL